MKKLYEKFYESIILANQEISLHISSNLTNDDYLTKIEVGEGGDSSKGIDLYAENVFKQYLLEYGDIYSEESGLIPSNNPYFKNALIIIDPLDGSDNFLSSIPYFGSSVSLQIDKITQFGLVYNFLDNTHIFRSPFQSNLINTNYSKLGIFERSYTRSDICVKLQEKNIKFRSPGASALSLANVHNVQFVLIAGSLRDFDVDAALFIHKDKFIYKNDHFLLISKDEKTFTTIKEIIKDY